MQLQRSHGELDSPRVTATGDMVNVRVSYADVPQEPFSSDTYVPRGYRDRISELKENLRQEKSESHDLRRIIAAYDADIDFVLGSKVLCGNGSLEQNIRELKIVSKQMQTTLSDLNRNNVRQSRINASLVTKVKNAFTESCDGALEQMVAERQLRLSEIESDIRAIERQIAVNDFSS